MARTLLPLFAGILACSTSVIFIKQSNAHPTLLAAYRLLFASLFLFPLFLRAWREHRDGFTLRHLLRAAVPGLVLAVHFISWNVGARRTLAANASLLVNMTPIVMPLLLFVILREVVNRRELLGTLIAMCGVAMLVVSDYVWSPDYVRGDLICFGSMTLFAGYLALARLNRDFASIWLYVVPLYFIASIISFATAWAWPGVDAIAIPPRTEIMWMLCLALIPTITGHSLLNRAMKHLRGQIVAICNLSQFLFAALLAFLVLGEVPTWILLPASALIIAGCVLAIRSGTSDP